MEFATTSSTKSFDCSHHERNRGSTFAVGEMTAKPVEATNLSGTRSTVQTAHRYSAYRTTGK